MLKQDLTVYDPYPEGIESTAIYANKVGQTYFEINNYLGNVNAVITDRKSANLNPSASNASTWEAVVINTSDYYPFGMQMPGRSNSYGAGVEYRYAYNGMETDNEVCGNGNSYTTEFRQYDPCLGRWKSLDPLMAKYSDLSPYNAFENNPVVNTDPDGLEIIGNRQQRRELKKRDDWKGKGGIKDTYKGKGKGKRDLQLTEVSDAQAEKHNLTTIKDSEISEKKLGDEPKEGEVDKNDMDKNRDHIYHEKMTDTKKQTTRISNFSSGTMTSRFPKVRVGGFNKISGEYTRKVTLPERDMGSTTVDFIFTPTSKYSGATGNYTVNFKVWDEGGTLLLDQNISSFVVSTESGGSSGWSGAMPLRTVSDKIIIQATLVNAPGGITDIEYKNRTFAYGVRIKSTVTGLKRGWQGRRIHSKFRFFHN